MKLEVSRATPESQNALTKSKKIDLEEKIETYIWLSLIGKEVSSC